MAKNTAVQLLDDITGEPAEETVLFAFEGIEYQIDLSGENAETLREVLERHANAGRRTGGRKRKRRIIALPAKKKTTARKSAAAEKKPAKAAKSTGTKRQAAAKKSEPVKKNETKNTRKTAAKKAPVRKAPPVTFSAAK
ncbi:Lsr2 dimerization domain-containing protein [Amycolatopsis suaedae]|uniref:Lsr2 family protein n=1 Tax=Amycolatopsis suaedae TaxID=2510978 RepID=A0A4Q7JAR2_9PSEU|nr:histone-like nucleoid-structuring protein Lsr2 [Amycolatopsis suaedae]RZQ64871.1 Lsr2 family protein [Amycolatopsis suaedae]